MSSIKTLIQMNNVEMGKVCAFSKLPSEPSEFTQFLIYFVLELEQLENLRSYLAAIQQKNIKYGFQYWILPVNIWKLLALLKIKAGQKGKLGKQFQGSCPEFFMVISSVYRLQNYKQNSLNTAEWHCLHLQNYRSAFVSPQEGI